LKASESEHDGQSVTEKPKPAKERMAAWRIRMKERGFRQLIVWALPEDHETIREFAKALEKKKQSNDKA
jgi:hypothetical protein